MLLGDFGKKLFDETRDGAPMGLSLLGPRGSDRSLVALAQRLAAAGVGA